MFARPCLLYSVKADAPYFTICLQRMQDPELNFFLQTTEQGIPVSLLIYTSSVTFPSSLQLLHFIPSSQFLHDAISCSYEVFVSKK